MKSIRILIVSLSVIAAAAAFASAAFSQSQGTDKLSRLRSSVRKEISTLWKDVDRAVRQDRPKTAIGYLETIRMKSHGIESSWDYYRACRQMYDLGAQMNWRKRDSLQTAFKSNIRLYSHPIVSLRYMLDYRGEISEGIKTPVEYIKFEKDRLKASSTPEFMINADIYDVMAPVLKSGTFFSNDYQNALCLTALSDWSKEAAELLQEDLQGTYPQGAWAEYLVIQRTGFDDNDKRKADLEAFESKYRGKAVSTFASYDLLSDRFDRLQGDRNSTSDDYLALRDDLRNLISRCKSFSGLEKSIAENCQAKSLLETLEAKSVRSNVKDKVLTVYFRNLKSVSLTMSPKDSKKTVWKKTVNNPKGRFFLQDTVTVQIPEVSDGEYDITLDYGSKDKTSLVYSQYTISVATRVYAGHYQIYAADYLTGEPLETLDQMPLNGFTFLPEDIEDSIRHGKGEGYRFTYTSQTGLVRKSPGLGKYSFSEPSKITPEKIENVVILTDCGAYHPGDTVRFKAIGFNSITTEDDSFREVMPEGTPLNVTLVDPDGNDLESLSLKTNDFGSVTGAFRLPEGGKNGQFCLRAMTPSGRPFYSYVSVGDHVLPSFDVVIDGQDRYIFKGESIHVTGRVVTYSGRSFGQGKASAHIMGVIDGKYKDEYRDLQVSPDGSFAFDIDGAEGVVHVDATVTDATGESRYVAGKAFRVVEDPSFSVSVTNFADDCLLGMVRQKTNPRIYSSIYSRAERILSGDKLDVRFEKSYDDRTSDFKVTYMLYSDGVLLLEGTTSELAVSIPVPDTESCIYTLKAYSLVEGHKSSESEVKFVKFTPGTESVSSKVAYALLKTGDLSVRIGSGPKDLWAVVSLYSQKGQILSSKLVHVPSSEAMTVSFERRSGWEGNLTMNFVWLRDSEKVTWNCRFTGETQAREMPLEFSSFTDRTTPSQSATITIRTDPSSEVAVSVFDKSTLAISGNYWAQYGPSTHPVVFIPMIGGVTGNSSSYALFGSSRLVKSGPLLTKAAGSANMMMLEREESAMVADDMFMSVETSASASYDSSYYDEDVLEEEAIPFALAGDTQAEPLIRSEKLDVLAFEPSLRPDSDGTVSFTFSPSGKLSTYIVKAYSHDRSMLSKSIEREVVVSLPLEVSLSAPTFLYEGDRYTLHAAVSASEDNPVTEGSMGLIVYGSKDGSGKQIFNQSKRLTLKDGVADCEFTLAPVPSSEDGFISFKLVFITHDDMGRTLSDGVLENCPVYPVTRQMTESHSGVLSSGDDRQALVSILRSQFTNLDPKDAVESERTIAHMIADVLDESREPRSEDAVSVMQAITVRTLSAKLMGTTADTEDLVKRLLVFRNADGGFSWRPDMTSSEYVTAYILSAVSSLRSAGVLPESLKDMSSSVRYLDSAFAKSRKSWSAIAVDTYCEVRSMYSEVPLGKSFPSDVKKSIREYIQDKGYSAGNIMLKTRRVLTLDRLLSDEEGIALAKDWGLAIATVRTLSSSRKNDIASLREYAQSHPEGGVFFPNAVMPYRGLLESELYAHTLLAHLFSTEDQNLSDSIRLWIMLQKETQEWGSDPTAVLAIAEVMNGSLSLLDTKVVTLSVIKEQAFRDTRSAGNAMSVQTTYYVREKNSWRKLADGETLSVGQKVRAEYSLYSEQNRSFVMLEAPRPACLLPDDQKSGPQWFSAYGLYRDVRRDCTQYWWDTFPEDKTKITEYFTVSQEGVFQSPASRIQCLYAPHWMANDSAREPMRTSFPSASAR